MLFRPKCSCCDRAAASIEVIAPQAEPAEWLSWTQERQQIFAKYRRANQFLLLYEGPGGSNGWVGDAITPERAQQIIAACASANPAAIRDAGFYDDAGFCAACGAFYCPTHWSISSTGYGVCPAGHGKSLDPHWYPDW